MRELLGCSVKKKMIPVLDYLEKLGARRSTLTDFLRRYPQVLHSSAVVDLEPVVKYLQGMDIKPNDVPRVLERYPEVLGLRMRVGRVIKPSVDYLQSLVIPRPAVAALIEKRPHILGFRLEDQVKPNVEALIEFGVWKDSLASVIAQYPEIIGLDLQPKLLAPQNLQTNIHVKAEDFRRLIEKMPQIVSLSRDPSLKHIDFLKECGFSLTQLRKMVVGCPQLLVLNINIMKQSFQYFQSEMGGELEDLVSFPAFFTCGLDSSIKPSHRMVTRKGLECWLSWLLNCSDERFRDRMTYDSEESFEMNSLTESRDADYVCN
ncbi:hypothetical protein ACHQM5_026920 [Ranunculus cassubicifolius]